MKKFLSILLLVLTICTFTYTNTFAMPSSTQVIAPHQQTYRFKFMEITNHLNLKAWGIPVGECSISVPAIHEETWIVDGYGNDIELVSRRVYYDTSRSMDIVSYSTIPTFDVASISGSFTSSVATVKYKIVNTKVGGSYSGTIYSYPYQG